MRIEIIIDDEAIVNKDCGCKAKKVIDLIDNLNEEEFEKIKFYLLQRESRVELTLEKKEAYVAIIANLLGLRADATVDRITPAVVKKVDEYLQAEKDCVATIKFVFDQFTNIILSLAHTTVVVDTIIKAIQTILDAEKDNLIRPACYIALRRKYAQEVQYLFFWGEDSNNKKYIEIK